MNILLVDDDAAILKSLLPILNGLDGHTVRVSTSFDKALEHARDLGAVHLLITGVVMEPVDGFTLRDRLRDRFPDLRTILISGYDLSDYGAQTGGYTLLQKPIAAEDLRAAVGRELEAAPSEPRVRDEEEGKPEADRATGEPAKETAKPEPTPVAPMAPSKPSVPAAKPVSAVPTAKAPDTPSIPVPKAAPVASVAPSVPSIPPPKAAVPVATPKATPAAPPAITHSTDQPRPDSQAQAPLARPPVAASGPSIKPSAAAPSALPKPTGVPLARPAGVPVARPAGMPTARPTVSAPGATPTARPAGTATPVPAVSARPVAVPKPQAAAPAAPSASGAEADELTGKKLGDYRIIRRMEEGRWGPTYEAEQISMGRTVTLQVLAQDEKDDASRKKQFIANASAKANIQHPVILSVYEAGEADGHCYYTHEHVDGESLDAMQKAGVSIDETTALLAVRVAAEGIAFINSQKAQHAPLRAANILVGSDKRPRLANLATHGESDAPDTQAEIRELGRIVSSALPPPLVSSGRLQKLFAKMQDKGEGGFQSWAALLQAVKALEPKIIPADAFKLGAQEEAAIRAVESEKKSQKKSLILGILGMTSLLLAIGLAVYFMFIHSNERNTTQMVKIPAGEFIFQDGQKVTLPEYYIGKYEVTMGQYARFLKALEAEGTEAKPSAAYDHPDQPTDKTHYPRSKATWDTYYGRAKAGKPARYIPIDLNSPVFNVDWWDAYAFAKWKGLRLPTEQEWEKAARGTKGLKYPWGNEFDPKKVNSAADYVEKPGPNTKAEVDGYWWWSPVDADTGDTSPFDVVGMAGNLNEWTSTWEEKDGTKFPVLRGGSFRSKENGQPNVTATFRFVGLDPEYSQEFVGFRTASDTPPKD